LLRHSFHKIHTFSVAANYRQLNARQFLHTGIPSLAVQDSYKYFTYKLKENKKVNYEKIFFELKP